MKPRCCLCGRLVLHPAVLIGNLPVGSTCAKRAGLVDLARRKAGALVLPKVRFTRAAPHENLNLFDEDDE